MTERRERPILFSTPMVREIQGGRKTQTRRVAKRQDVLQRAYSPIVNSGEIYNYSGEQLLVRSPYRVGDLLWVREAWQFADWTEDGYPWIRYKADGAKIFHERFPEEWSPKLIDIWAELSESSNYAIDNRAADRRWRPSIHMPKWAARLWLEVTDVRAERVRHISNEDAKAEGAPPVLVPPDGGDRPYYEGFRNLWNELNAKRDYSFESNPWVWATTFRPVSRESIGERSR